jgi:rubrerythrin
MKCPDCKIEMEKQDKYYVGSDGGYVRQDEPYWKCPRCKIEVEEEE